NTDTVVPQFGHYSSASATLVSTSTDARVGKCNITQTVLNIPPMVNDFYQNNRGATSGATAFSAVSYTNLYTPPAGDQFLAKSGTATTPPTFAVTVQDVTGATAAQITAKTDPLPRQGTGGVSNGYSQSTFAGSTQGPGYWGKTFFVWPP